MKRLARPRAPRQRIAIPSAGRGDRPSHAYASPASPPWLAWHGAPVMRAARGLHSQGGRDRRQELASLEQYMGQNREGELDARNGEGGVREAAIPGLL